MGRTSDTIDDALAALLAAQHVLFVATSPLAADGLVDPSAKGLAWTARKEPDDIAEQRAERNRSSLDGLPGLATPTAPRARE